MPSTSSRTRCGDTALEGRLLPGNKLGNDGQPGRRRVDCIGVILDDVCVRSRERISSTWRTIDSVTELLEPIGQSPLFRTFHAR